jgi:hypothetical protein
MTRQQLEMLGEAGLRQMARRVGLRGARHHHRSLLITGLAAYFARRPAQDETDDGAQDEPDEESLLGATGIPPALATETMARLLETQGNKTQAVALRARLDQTVPRKSAPTVHLESGTHDGVDLVWEGATDAQRCLVVRLWTKDNAPTQWELPLTACQGRIQFDPPPDTTRMCAALGQLSPDGFAPAARSAIIVLIDERSP